MSARDRRLAEKYAAQGRESASARAARLKREKEATRHKTDSPSPRNYRGGGSGDTFDAAAWYDEYRNTPKSRSNRLKSRRSRPAGGGEEFADRSARSITRWFRS